MPEIEVLEADILNHANGAFATLTNQIYINSNFLANASITAITGVLLEEIGHYLDSQINSVDSSGDKGDIFAQLVQGQPLSSVELALLKQEDDHGFISLNNQLIAVEFQNFLRNNTMSPLQAYWQWRNR